MQNEQEDYGSWEDFSQDVELDTAMTDITPDNVEETLPLHVPLTDPETPGGRGLATASEFIEGITGIGKKDLSETEEDWAGQYELNRMIDPMIGIGGAMAAEKVARLGKSYFKGTGTMKGGLHSLGLRMGWETWEQGNEYLEAMGMSPAWSSSFAGAGAVATYRGITKTAPWAARAIGTYTNNPLRAISGYGSAINVIQTQIKNRTGQDIAAKLASGRFTAKALAKEAKTLRALIPGQVQVEMQALNKATQATIRKELGKETSKRFFDVVTNKSMFSEIITKFATKHPAKVAMWSKLASGGVAGEGSVLGSLAGLGLHLWLVQDVARFAMSEDGNALWDMVMGSAFPKSHHSKGLVYMKSVREGKNPMTDLQGNVLPEEEQEFGWSPDISGLSRPYDKTDASEPATYGEFMSGENEWLKGPVLPK